MSANINCVIISGHVTRDPELRTTQSGSAVLGFGVAVNDRRKNPSTGEWEDVPNFVDCVVFGNRAEPLSRFLAKGSKVCVKGRLRWSQWERDGQKRSKLEVIADEIEFLSPRQNGQNQGGQGGGYGQNQGGYGQNQGGYGQNQGGSYRQQPQMQQHQYQQPTYATPPAPPSAVYDEDIPF